MVDPRVLARANAITRDKVVSEGRRRALKVMAASAALAGSGCSEPPQEDILPYVRMPERTVTGLPVFYASTLRRNGYGFGVLVETNMGRPTKIEGNPQHPASLGATDIFAQSAILQLWDPDRSRTVRFDGQVSTWLRFQEALRERLARLRHRGGLRILTGPISSPTLTDRIQTLLQRYPGAQWHSYDPAASTSADVAINTIYAPGSGPRGGVRLHYHLDRVRTLVTLDADLLASGPESVRYAKDFLRGRGDDPERSRLYVVETTPSATGVQADERLSLAPQSIEALIAYLGHALGASNLPTPLWPESATQDYVRPWVKRLAQQLSAQDGDSLIVGGAGLSETAHTLIWHLNKHLGNIGNTLGAYACMAPTATVTELIKDMEAGEVDTLLIVDANPAYDLPPSSEFVSALQKVGCSIHMDLYADETAHHVNWHLPRCHDLEDWSDARSTDGTPSIIQPAIASLYGGRSPHWLLGQFAASEPASAYDDVRAYWQNRWGLSDALFEERWHQALREGIIANDPVPQLFAVNSTEWTHEHASRLGHDDADSALHTSANPQAHTDEPLLTAVFVNDSNVDTGTYANLSWLQELPRPLTRLTWDNAALMGPTTAKRYGVITGDVVLLKNPSSQQQLKAAVYVLPNHAEHCLSLPLGYGRRHGGSVAQDIGFDAYALQNMDVHGPQRLAQVIMEPTGTRHHFAQVQTEYDVHDRPIIRHVELDERTEQHQSQPSLYPEYEYPSYAWAMTIDLDTCIGCNACVVACQAENNIPVVGKEEVARGRAMHWLRIDYYHERNTGRQSFQPMACQHCENAPCEVVCPVGATLHDSEGLNVQVYNRCVGTRFCSNNCPYKVRRFNFFQYSDSTSHEARARRNPEVTVRERGVMEKCTYCVQRISRARIDAEKRGQRIQDGEVITACQAACPTEAIVFGDINDAQSRISAAKSSPRNYQVLDELNTRPRTSYLARVIKKGGRHG